MHGSFLLPFVLNIIQVVTLAPFCNAQESSNLKDVPVVIVSSENVPTRIQK